ncbi:50S ribosomal protein L4 [Desulfofustis limnaeus]|jgi:large subunit ribosomal protein L4|uniref:Large ribosomal subunit protein uL4 n=1 Tax=Desulfofustis limnaeus TaxID=2740163 RepID=A0ABN6LZR2_9BACT|nr:50S ribosomal protein L4 [Desulfofustis limnaeus]MDX9895805.1 50S ribosomal protein L4 [Desulfofustis sp.]BDD86133.1 50S ribosomal protein L4 [Desulfofustis limnaeus]
MSTVEVKNIKNEKVGEIELNDLIFNRQVKPYLLHDVVRMQRAAKRAGTASTKGRGDVKGSSSKPWRQKGTGRARAGNKRSPLWRGGGVVHGPKPRDFSFKLNRKVKQQAVSMAMSARFQEGNLVVLDRFTMEAIKTKDFVTIMNVLQLENALIVIDGDNENLSKSSRNVPGYKVMKTDGVNVYDILLHDKLVLLQPAISSLEERLTA